MKHAHEVAEANPDFPYEHDSAPSWHVEHADEVNDHPLAVLVAAKGALTEGDRFTHAAIT